MNIAQLLLIFFAPKAKAFEKATRDPVGTQEKVLSEFICRNKDTEYGLRYKFSSIKSIADYQKAVPLSNSETMRPFLMKMAKGKSNILTVDEPVFFGATSGTTKAPKYIPSTKYSDSKKNELLDLWSYYITRDHPDVLKGKILAIVSPEVEGYTEGGVPYGGESGHGYKNLPWLIKYLYVVPYEVFQLEDYDARYYSILRFSMEHDVTTIATLNPNSIILLCQKIKKWADIIIEDIRRGTLSGNFNIPEAARKIVERRLRPNPKRADELKDILRKKKGLLPKDFWPDMQLVECWKGGMMRIYLKELELYFGNIPVRDIGCLSTEARSSIPMSDKGAGGVLAIQTNFYEFIPREDMAKSNKTVLLADQLQKGKEYFIVVTTPGGLYRYNIDDIIRVDGFFNKTPVIEFVQKGLSATSLAGEKLYESQLNEALKNVLDRNRLLIKFFCAVIQQEGIPHYAFLAEFSGDPSGEDKRKFLESLEEELYRQNREYNYVRKSQLLGPPVLKTVRKGSFEEYRARKIAEGAHEGQFKVPELTADMAFEKNFDIAEEIHID